MSTAAADNAQPVTPAAENVDLEPSLKALFGSLEGDAPVEEKSERGLSLTEAIVEQPPEEQKKKTETAPPPAPTEEKKPDAAPPAETKPEDEDEKPIRGRRRSTATPPAVAPVPAAAAPAATPPAKPEDELAGVELLEEEKDNLELARFAEKSNPTKYAGLSGKMTKFIKDHAKFLDEQRKLDPDVQFDANNTTYQAFLAKNKPVLSNAEIRSLERERTAEVTRAQLAPEFEKVNDELFRRDAEPEVTREGDKFLRSAVESAAPDALREVIQKEGLAKAKEKFPFEYAVVAEVTEHATADMEEFMRLTKHNPKTGRSLRAYDPKNEQHVRVLGFVNGVCDQFKQTGGKERVKDGKQFLTRDEYFRLASEQRAPYWTFTNEDIVERAKRTVKDVIAKRITLEEKRLEGLGFRRQAATPATPPPNPPAPPPGAPPAPRAGPAPTQQQQTEEPVDKFKGILLGS